MQEILNKLNEVVWICESRVKQCDEDAAKNAAQSSKNEADLKDIERLRAETLYAADRVQDLIHIADVRAELESTKELVKQELAKIDNAKKEFEDWKGAEEKRIKEEMSDIHRRQEKLTASELKLDEEKRAYKIKIIEQVNRESKVKK